MIGKISAILASAACAYLLVTLVPGFTPEVAARAAPQPALPQAATGHDTTAAALHRKPACVETWPYYEPECLRDDRQPDGRARIVRIVSTERTAPRGFASRAR